MRRDIWLAGVAGAVVGSWLTLIAVQVSENGFHLPGRGESKTEAESHPAAAAAPKPAAIEIMQANVTPAIAAPAKAQALADTAPQKAPPATDALQDKASFALPATASTVAPDDQDATSTEKPATEPQSKPPADTIKTEAPEAKKLEPEQSSSKQAPADQPPPQQTRAEQTKTEQTSPPPAPADQADRAAAAAAHRTVPMAPSSQQASPGDSQKPGDDRKPSGGAEPVELVRPSSDRAGMLTVGSRSVQLSGIIPTDVARTCTGSDGKSWPCGTAARTAFRMYLRGRTIDCDLPSPAWQGTVTGNCRYVRIDLSEWLVRFGWAEPEAGSPLEAVAEQAKQQKRGIYGDDPRKGRKSTLAPAPPKEDPLNPI